MTPPASIDTVPTVALIAVAVPSATSIPPTCSTRSRAAGRPISSRSRIAPTRISAMLPGLLAEQASERQSRVVEEQLSR